MPPIRRLATGPTVIREGPTTPNGPKPTVASRFRGLLRRLPAITIGAVVVLGLTLLGITGNPLAAVLPVILASVVWLVWTLPLRYTLGVLVFAQTFFFQPAYVYARGPLWSLMKPGHDFTNVLLNKVVPVGALSLTGQELGYGALLMLMSIRILRRDRVDMVGRKPGTNLLFVFLALELLVTVWLEVWGAAKGGTMRWSFFQMRPFIMLPLETAVISFAMRDSRDFISVAITMTAAVVLKIAIGWTFVRQDLAYGYKPPYMTSHGDTVLFVTVLFCWVAAWMHQHSWKRLFGTLVLMGWILVGIQVNNRRIAWVSLVASFIVFYTVVNGNLRRRVNLALAAVAPFVAVYLLLARTRTTGFFAPGAQLIGIAGTSDGSSQWRVLEIQNLIFTLRQQRIFGSGFGHEWIEIIKLPEISAAFPQYRQAAHNSVLWILGLSGAFGFIFLWMPLVVGIFLAARSYRFARNPFERTAAATCMTIALCFVNQSWGDLGLVEPLNILLMATSLALLGKLAIETGAWPSKASIVGW